MSSYIGRININNTEYPIAQSLFGTCNTTANTATKVVTCADFDTLISGIVINVYFTYANTESSISLNVNSTGNKTVYVDNNSSILWDAGATKSFVYYNNQWRLINPTSVGTTYSAATTAAAGLMSAADKLKVDELDSKYVPIETNSDNLKSIINNQEGYLLQAKSLTLQGEEVTAQAGLSIFNDEGNPAVNMTSYSSYGQSGIGIRNNIPAVELHSNNNNVLIDGSYGITLRTNYTNNNNYNLISLKYGTDGYDGIRMESKLGITIGSRTPYISIGTNTTSGVQITQVADPVNAEDAANKRYIDNSIASIPASTYAAGTGLSLSGTTFNHTNSITASSVGSSVATSGATLDIPYAKYDAQGHITAKGTHVHTIGSLAASAITSGTFATARIPSLPTSIITSGTFATARIPNLPASIITSGTLGTAILPTVPIAKGGTGATTAAAARTNLGLGSAAVASTSASVDNNTNLPTGAAIQSYVTGLGYEANQNAFTTVKVGTTDLVADSKTDTLTITAGNNITLTPNASSDSFSIAATNTTYSNATSSAAGLMSAADKQTLDGLVASGGEVNQNAFSNVVIGSSTVAADSKTDTLTLAGANGISLSANTSTDTITIDGTKFVLKDATSATTGEGGTITNSTSGVLLSALGDTTDASISVTKTSGSGITLKHQGTSSTSTILVKDGVSIDSNAAINIGTGSTGSVTITNLVTPTNNSDAATKAYVDNIISGGILKGIRINSSDSYVSSLGSNVYLITHNQGFAENFTSTVMVKDSSSSYFYQAINDDGVSLVYTNGKIRYDIFDIQENQFKIEFSSVPYQFSILINTNYDSLSLVDVDSTSTLLSI